MALAGYSRPEAALYVLSDFPRLRMNDVLFFLVLGIFFTLPCVLLFAVFYKNYFSLAFAKERPRLLGKDAAQTDAIVFYYVTKVFLFCFVGVLVFYIAGIAKSLIK